MKIAKTVLPSLMNRCKDLLQKFITDEKKSGNFPTPRFKLTEVCFVLRQLQVLELHPDLNITDKVETSMRGKKRHLLKLFPVLCDCITTKESEVKELLKDLFHEVGRELSLE